MKSQSQFTQGQRVNVKVNECGQWRTRPAIVTEPSPYDGRDGAYVQWSDLSQPHRWNVSQGGWQPGHCIEASR